MHHHHHHTTTITHHLTTTVPNHRHALTTTPTTQSEVEETLERVKVQNGVEGYVICNRQGLVLRRFPQMSQEHAEQYADSMRHLANKARGVVRDLNPQVSRPCEHGRGDPRRARTTADQTAATPPSSRRPPPPPPPTTQQPPTHPPSPSPPPAPLAERAEVSANPGEAARGDDRV